MPLAPLGTSAPAADRLLECQISSQLAESSRPALKRLAVRVTGGSVTLHGRVASFYEKQLAIQTCRMLAGIDRLIDAVEVAGAAH
jgi:osmotically-inducible protein OsmY